MSPEPGAAADTRPAIRAASLEILRYASAGSLVLVAVTSVWSTIRAVSLAEPISAGRMAGVDVDHLDRARTMTSIALAIAAPMQAWWLVAAGRWMRRAGVPCSGFPALASALISTEFALAFGVGLVFGAPQRLLIPLLVLAGVGAWAAILTAGPIADWIGATPLRLNLWATGIILSTIVHAFAGGTAPVTPTTSVQTVAFASVVLGLVVANTAIVGGLFMLNFEDDIRSSSAIVRSFRTPRTRRNSDV